MGKIAEERKNERDGKRGGGSEEGEGGKGSKKGRKKRREGEERTGKKKLRERYIKQEVVIWKVRLGREGE